MNNQQQYVKRTGRVPALLKLTNKEKGYLRRQLPKNALWFQRAQIDSGVWDAWDQKKRKWKQIKADGSVVGYGEKGYDDNVEGWVNEEYGYVSMVYLCNVHPMSKLPVKIVYEQPVRYNGGITRSGQNIAGTPSGFTALFRQDPITERWQIGTMQESRPFIQDVLNVREDGTYINRFGVVETYYSQPEDFYEEFFKDSHALDTFIEKNRKKIDGERLEENNETSARLVEEGKLVVDEKRFIVLKTVIRPGVTLEGSPGGWGSKGKAAIDTAAKELLQEAGFDLIPRGRLIACSDRARESTFDWFFWLDLTEFYATGKQQQLQDLDIGEVINPNLIWTNVDEFDWNLMGDEHLIMAAMSALIDLGLISSIPVSELSITALVKMVFKRLFSTN